MLATTIHLVHHALTMYACMHVIYACSQIIISCITDVAAGIALMHEPPETDIMLTKPRNVKTDRLVTGPLIFYSYMFYGNLQSLGSFIIW